jgi:hypothetical protein
MGATRHIMVGTLHALLTPTVRKSGMCEAISREVRPGRERVPFSEQNLYITFLDRALRRRSSEMESSPKSVTKGFITS